MRYIDLTLSYEKGMRGFDSSTAKTLAVDGWNAQTLQIYSHAGTHMDAPFHFEVNDSFIDNYPVDRFFVTCWVLKLQNIGKSHLITIDVISSISDKIKSGEGLIFHTGWSKYIGQPEYRDDLPRISNELAKWLVNRGIRLIGVEPPSIADVNNLEELSEIHRILLEGDVIIVEGLTNLESITSEKVEMVALPLKIEGGDGAPCRVIAIEK